MAILDERSPHESPAPAGSRCFYCGGVAIRLSTISPGGEVPICSSRNLTVCIGDMKAHNGTPFALRGQA